MIIVTQGAVPIAFLPQRPARSSFLVIATQLLEEIDPLYEIAVVAKPFQQYVNMVGHDGVRNYFEATRARSSQYLLNHEPTSGRLNEYRLLEMGAKRNEVRVFSQIFRSIEFVRMVGHTETAAIHLPSHSGGRRL